MRRGHLLPAGGVSQDALIGIATQASRRESGDPLDLALLGPEARHGAERLATFPFTEDRRREVAVVRTCAGALHALVKGAPEVVLAVATLDESAREVWQRRTDELAAAGHKVLACAMRELTQWHGEEPDRDYRFAGLIAFEDPVRAGAADAVAQAQAAGIRVIMVSGDHPATATTIARELGIGSGTPRVIEGAALAEALLAGEALSARRCNRARPVQCKSSISCAPCKAQAKSSR